MKTSLKILIAALILIALVGGGYYYSRNHIPKAPNPLLESTSASDYEQSEVDVDLTVKAPDQPPSVQPTEKPKPLVAPPSPDSSAPWRSLSAFDLKPAFASQAPTGDWDEPYQNACEEAAAIIAAHYFLEQPLDAAIMDQEIKKLVAWEVAKFGYYEDTPLSQIKIILNDYFQVQAEILNKPTTDQIKQALYRGHLILVPASGRRLDQPNFTAPGPIYHALIIRGWQREQFITNDPGTRKGDGFKYDYENLLQAIYDPPTGGATMDVETLEQGSRAVLIIGPKVLN